MFPYYDLRQRFKGAPAGNKEVFYMLFGKGSRVTYLTKDGRLLHGNSVVGSLHVGRNFIQSRWIRCYQRRFRVRRKRRLYQALLQSLQSLCCRRAVCWKVGQFLRLRPPHMPFFERLGYKHFVGEVLSFAHSDYSEQPLYRRWNPLDFNRVILTRRSENCK